MHFKHLGPLKHFMLPRFSMLVLYTMNLENCHCLSTIRSNSSLSWSSYERIGYDPIVCVNKFVTKLKMGSWKALWRKIKRERKRFFRTTTSWFGCRLQLILVAKSNIQPHVTALGRAIGCCHSFWGLTEPTPLIISFFSI